MRTEKTLTKTRQVGRRVIRESTITSTDWNYQLRNQSDIGTERETSLLGVVSKSQMETSNNSFVGCCCFGGCVLAVHS